MEHEMYGTVRLSYSDLIVLQKIKTFRICIPGIGRLYITLSIQLYANLHFLSLADILACSMQDLSALESWFLRETKSFLLYTQWPHVSLFLLKSKKYIFYINWLFFTLFPCFHQFLPTFQLQSLEDEW